MIAYIRATRRVWVLVLALLMACTPLEQQRDQQLTAVPASSTSGPIATVPPADQLLARALHAHALGDYEASGNDLSALLTAYPQAPEAWPARYYLAESYAQRDHWTSAVDTLHTLLADGIKDALAARAQFWLARGYESAGDWAQAAAAYQAYRDLKTSLEPYAAMRQAAQQQSLGQFAAAAQTYEYAAQTDIDRGERAGSYEKAIALREQLGQKDTALGLYDALLSLAQEPDYRAQVLLKAAALAREQNQQERARTWLREIVDATPASTQAPEAVTQLLADSTYQASPAALSQATAARIYFTAERYNEALPLFEGAIATASGDDALALRRLHALTLRGQQHLQGALDELAAISTESPDSETGRQAQLDHIQTLGWNGQTDDAIDAYRQFATTYGDPSTPATLDPRAPEALARVAELLDRKGDSAGASQQRLDLAKRYPTSEQARDALAATGLHLYRHGQIADAQMAWSTLADNTAAEPTERTQATFWAGIAADQQQQRDQAQTFWQRAQSLQPDSYYGTRAADKLIDAGIPISNTTTPRAIAAPISDSDWQDVSQWVDKAFGTVEPQVAEHANAGEVAHNNHVVRAQALEDVGLQSESVAEWLDARDDFGDDPHMLLLLARLAHEHDTPYVALSVASRLVKLTPTTAPAPPDTLRRLIYPTPYSDLVLAQAQQQGIDPLLVYALLRQESLFNPGAVSGAGAYGLAQVMPDTGRGIAQRLGIEDFDPALLLHPAMSVRFGTFYIAQQIKNMDGSTQAGLAAYNGGPGNARRWIEETGLRDPDLYVENIDYGETRSYVKLVYAQYDIYRRLYTTR